MRADIQRGRQTVAVHLTVGEIERLKSDPEFVVEMLKMSSLAADVFSDLLVESP